MKGLPKVMLQISAIVALMFLRTFNAYSQELTKDELEKRAFYFFDSDRYEKALPDYQSLHAMYPKEEKFAYYLGNCYLFTRQNLDQSIELLKFSAGKNYKIDAFFYLAQAYHYVYRFDDATLAYETFKSKASKAEMKRLQVAYHQNINEDAKLSTNVVRSLSISNLTQVPANAPESAFANSVSGKFIYIPEEFRSDEDRAKNYQGLMFLPEGMKLGEYLYFSSNSKSGKNGTDLYCTKRLSNGDFSLPEILPANINSPYDEAYPFLDRTNGVLYFSSKGHTTSGGFDIFKTRYDSINNVWTKPEKLDFPINSVANDLLFTLSNNGQSAQFLSDRNTDMHNFIVYTFQNPNTADFVTLSSTSNLLKYSMLEEISLETKNSVLNTDTKPEIIETATPFVYVPTVPVSKYDLLVSEALELQTQCDSLNWMLKEMKLNLAQESSSDKKQIISNEIAVSSKVARQKQKLADQKFAEAEKINNSVTEDEKAVAVIDLPKDISTTKSENGIINESNTEGYALGVEAANKIGKNAASEFTIMNNSPYSNNNPIPYSSLPPGLVYRIQLGSFSTKVSENSFGGLAPVNLESVNDKGTTKYFVGYFYTLNDARKGLESVRQYGFPDAFLLCFYDKQKISVEKAKELEFAEK